MKRIQEKVKDIVEVRDLGCFQDFIADPAQTLSNYHFTDVTSNLMAKWLDKAANVRVAKRSRVRPGRLPGRGKKSLPGGVGRDLVQSRIKVTGDRLARIGERTASKTAPLPGIVCKAREATKRSSRN